MVSLVLTTESIILKILQPLPVIAWVNIFGKMLTMFVIHVTPKIRLRKTVILIKTYIAYMYKFLKTVCD